MGGARIGRTIGGAAVAGAMLFGTASTAVADEVRDSQWPLKSFEAGSVWQQSTGKGVKVAVIDGAIDLDHPDLKGNLLPGKSFVNGGLDHATDHGTAMASLIAGHGHGPGNADGIKGLAPDAKIIPIEFPSYDEGDVAKFGGARLGEAIRYAVDAGAKVINISLGGDVKDFDRAQIAYAFKKDVLVVAGTGNEGGPLSGLSSSPGIVAVGAVKQDGKVWAKSNFGPQTMLTAPGVHIRTAGAYEPYRQASGTSDSTAYVSGAAALLRSKYPDLTAGQIANRLVKTAGMAPGMEGTHLPDPHYGYGFIRPLRALKEDIPAGSKNGPLKVPDDPYADVETSAPPPPPAKKTFLGDLSMAAVGGITLGGMAALALVIFLVVRKNNRRNGPPPGGPGGPGGPGSYGAPGTWAPPHPGPHQQHPGAVGFPPQPPPNRPMGS
ncbi:peptidase M8 [Streptomyces rimosus subsp. pseudoverticillatus]|uniref:S8 family serine peptidase n=1 Tax=Streptomyces rimosus TaxID=1927 RepID=UPI0006B274C5|nr:S8 family serine peptidase [Streptomyces rimosus]KOT99140.1 peptidase M8 [Streptomyces rimosus subsp. pseudoverticillatus]